MFTRGVVVEKFYPISYLTIKKTNKKKNKKKKKQNKNKAKKTFFWEEAGGGGMGVGEGFLPTFLPIFIFHKEHWFKKINIPYS